MTGVALLLADAPPQGEAAKSGPLWALVVGVLLIACFFLFRSMTRHLGKVRSGFPVDGSEPDDAAPADAEPAATPVLRDARGLRIEPGRAPAKTRVRPRRR